MQMPNSAAVALLRHSSTVSPESSLKHSLISTALLELHEISCPGTTVDGTNEPLSWLFVTFLLAEGVFPCPTTQKAPHRTPQDLDRRYCKPPPSCTKTPFTAGRRHYNSFGGVARNLASYCATTLAVKTIHSNNIHPILRANIKCISLPCSRVVMPTLLLRRYLLQDLFAAASGSAPVIVRLTRRQISPKSCMHRYADLVKVWPIDLRRTPASTAFLCLDTSALWLQAPGG